jgi:hypothetical protein
MVNGRGTNAYALGQVGIAERLEPHGLREFTRRVKNLLTDWPSA